MAQNRTCCCSTKRLTRSLLRLIANKYMISIIAKFSCPLGNLCRIFVSYLIIRYVSNFLYMYDGLNDLTTSPKSDTAVTFEKQLMTTVVDPKLNLRINPFNRETVEIVDTSTWAKPSSKYVINTTDLWESGNDTTQQHHRQRQRLPQWMIHYFRWHKEQTTTINGYDVAGTTTNNKYFYVTCFKEYRKCGGTADRLLSIPFFLKVAASTERLLLIQWTKPAALEEFLVPPVGGIDWRVHPEMDTLLQKSSIKTGTQDAIVQYAVQSNVSVVQVKFQSHDHGAIYYDKYRESKGEMDFNSVFHTVWNILFTPSPALASSINDVMRRAHLQPGQYTAAHLRALYIDDTRTTSMIQGWTHNAINCAVQLQNTMENVPVYFAADSDKALQYAKSYGKIFMVNIVIPETSFGQNPLHLDKTPDWRSRPPTDFFDAFIDLYIMGMSNGVAYGMGGYGRFASMLSNNSSRSLMHMSATYSAQCTAPPRRKRSSGLHNYYKRNDQKKYIANVFVPPMPPVKITSQK